MKMLNNSNSRYFLIICLFLCISSCSKEFDEPEYRIKYDNKELVLGLVFSVGPVADELFAYSENTYFLNQYEQNFPERHSEYVEYCYLLSATILENNSELIEDLKKSILAKRANSVEQQLNQLRMAAKTEILDDTRKRLQSILVEINTVYGSSFGPDDIDSDTKLLATLSEIKELALAIVINDSANRMTPASEYNILLNINGGLLRLSMVNTFKYIYNQVIAIDQAFVYDQIAAIAAVLIATIVIPGQDGIADPDNYSQLDRSMDDSAANLLKKEKLISDVIINLVTSE